MEKTELDKAIKQARATLLIDKLYLKETFIEEYRKSREQREVSKNNVLKRSLKKR